MSDWLEALNRVGLTLPTTVVALAVIFGIFFILSAIFRPLEFFGIKIEWTHWKAAVAGIIGLVLVGAVVPYLNFVILPRAAFEDAVTLLSSSNTWVERADDWCGNTAQCKESTKTAAQRIQAAYTSLNPYRLQPKAIEHHNR